MKYYNIQIMRKQVKLLLFVFILAAGYVRAADYMLVKSIPLKVQLFTTDHFGNSYLISSGTIFKFDSAGVQLATYSQKDLGVPQSIDASDPMKILVFYPNFATIRILDNKLTLQSTIDLHAIGIKQPLLACNTLNQTGFWVYDESDFTIKKINNQLKVELECIPLNKLFRNVNVNFLFETANWIMINNPTLGVIVFDKVGDYFHTVSVLDQQTFQAQYDQFYYVKNDSIVTCNIGNLEKSIVKLPPTKDVIEARVEPHRIFLRKPESVEIYSF